MYCDICSEPLSSTANGSRCASCRNLSGEFTDQILKLKVKWYKRIAEQLEKVDSKSTRKIKATYTKELEDDLLKCHNSVENNQQKKIIKRQGHCYDGTGWFECPFWNRHPENHRCVLFSKDGIPKNASHSLVICNRIYGETYEGDV
jgi:hypothetical protein